LLPVPSASSAPRLSTKSAGHANSHELRKTMIGDRDHFANSFPSIMAKAKKPSAGGLVEKDARESHSLNAKDAREDHSLSARPAYRRTSARLKDTHGLCIDFYIVLPYIVFLVLKLYFCLRNRGRVRLPCSSCARTKKLHLETQNVHYRRE
jgi:hypothetical protein